MIKEFLENIFKKKVEIETVTAEYHNKVIDELNNRIKSLTEINKSLTETKAKQKDRDVLEEGFK